MPADWIQRARIVALSWSGLRVPAIAKELGFHEQTVRRWLERFNASGLDGFADQGGQGRKRRITEAERSRIIALVKRPPPGRPVRGAGGELAAEDGAGPSEWTLDTLTAAALCVRRASRCTAARSGGSCSKRGSAGAGPVLDPQQGPRLRPKRTRIVGLYTAPPEGSTVLCVDELGPVIPRTFAPAPGWSPDGHRIKSETDYGRGPEKTWVYGALRPADGQEVTMATSSRNSADYQRILQALEKAKPDGEIVVVTDNLSSHNSLATRTWLENHPRISHAFIPVGACWLNLQEGWWRIFRKAALAGQSFAGPAEIEAATGLATAWLNTRAKPWIWGRPAPPTRTLRRRFVYLL